jgi:hypothetical protein
VVRRRGGAVDHAGLHDQVFLAGTVAATVTLRMGPPSRCEWVQKAPLASMLRASQNGMTSDRS